MLIKYITKLSKLFRVKQHSEKKPCVEPIPKYKDVDFDGAEFDAWCDRRKGSAVDKLLSSMKRCQ